MSGVSVRAILERAATAERRGDLDGAGALVLAIPRDAEGYREAAVWLVGFAERTGRFDFHLDHFLAPFAASTPVGADEARALYGLARLHELNGLGEVAAEIYQRVRQAAPGYADVEARLAALRSSGAAPRLPDLPPLPSLPLDAGPVQGTPAHRLGTTFPPMPPTPRPESHPWAASTHRHVVLDAAADALTPLPEEGMALASIPPQPAMRPRAALGGGFTPGELIAGRFLLEGELGRGGMAVVYRARDLELGEVVALKLLFAESDEESLRRFRQEVAVTRRIVHPNVVRVFDIGEHGGRRFLSMELVDGRPLSKLIAAGPIEPSRAAGILRQAADGLSAAHAAGVIHRDVKPDNLLITGVDVVKVTDFGIAKYLAAPSVTRLGVVAGTPLYVSPEQVSGFAPVTPLSDIYALGATAFELLTGAPPFVHDELVPLLYMHLAKPPPAVHERNPSVPRLLSELVAAMLAKSPASRPPSCAAIRDFLARF